MSLLWWAFLSLVVAVIAGAFGFRGVASGATTIAKVLFGIFLAIAVVIVLMVVLGIGAIA